MKSVNEVSFWRSIAGCLWAMYQKDIGTSSAALVLTDHEIASALPLGAKNHHVEGKAEWTLVPEAPNTLRDMDKYAGARVVSVMATRTVADELKFLHMQIEEQRLMLEAKDESIADLYEQIQQKDKTIEELEDSVDRSEDERDDALDRFEETRSVHPRAKLAHGFMVAEIQRAGLMSAMQTSFEHYLKLADDLIAAEKKTRPQELVTPHPPGQMWSFDAEGSRDKWEGCNAAQWVAMGGDIIDKKSIFEGESLSLHCCGTDCKEHKR